MPTDRPSGSFSALLPLAFLCAVLGACEAGGATGAGSPRADAQASASGRIPPLPEPFDSTGCYYHGATYRLHPDWDGDELFTYRLRIERAPKHLSSYNAVLAFEARDRRSGALVTTLRLQQTSSMGLSRNHAYIESADLSIIVQGINRDLGHEASGQIPRPEGSELQKYRASYVLQFTDLEHELHYRHGRWDDLGSAVTYHTKAQAKPTFPNRWLLSECGGK
jgi:hypothetical protein